MGNENSQPSRPHRTKIFNAAHLDSSVSAYNESPAAVRITQPDASYRDQPGTSSNCTNLQSVDHQRGHMNLYQNQASASRINSSNSPRNVYSEINQDSINKVVNTSSHINGHQRSGNDNFKNRNSSENRTLSSTINVKMGNVSKYPKLDEDGLQALNKVKLNDVNNSASDTHSAINSTLTKSQNLIPSPSETNRRDNGGTTTGSQNNSIIRLKSSMIVPNVQASPKIEKVNDNNFPNRFSGLTIKENNKKQTNQSTIYDHHKERNFRRDFGESSQIRSKSQVNFRNVNAQRRNQNDVFEHREHHNIQSHTNIRENRNRDNFQRRIDFIDNTRQDHTRNRDEPQKGNTSQKRNRYQKNSNKPENDTESIGSNDRSGNWDNTGMKKTSRKRNLGFRKLEEISEKDPEMIIVELQGSSFENLLNNELTNDMIVLVLKILSKICNSSFVNNKAVIINMISSDTFINRLSDYILRLNVQNKEDKRRNTYFWKEPDMFWNSLFIMCNTMLDVSPSMACDSLPKILTSCEGSLKLLKEWNVLQISDEIFQNLAELNQKFKLCRKQCEIEKEKAQVRMLEYEEPPNDFKEMSVYPTALEVTTPDKPFVRENIIKGAYRDVNHYLDVQFRLLREDFVAPLRKGICECLNSQITNSKNKKVSNVRIYQNVSFLYTKNVNDQVGVVLQFLSKKQKFKQNLENSKRFMHGSLMCFTKDNFASVIFGRITERKKEFLEEGQLVIGFEHEYNSSYEFNTPYIMVESTVYFEPYYHVLKALQTFDPEQFPMKSYIVDAVPNINPPIYLVNNEGLLKIDNFVIQAFDLQNWPKLEELDDTQLKAFQAALTQEFAVIQGPPGTGKTYLGLKIVKVLLDNSKLWNEKNKSPLLIVCFTNHALDQFLEGLLKFTRKIIRVGGQSKSEALKGYNLKDQKRKIQILKDSSIGQVMYEKRRELSYLLNEIEVINECMNAIIRNDGILDVKAFAKIEHNIVSSWFSTASNEDIVEWFFGGRTLEELEMEKQKEKLNEIRKHVLQMEVEEQEDIEEYAEEFNDNNEIVTDDFIFDFHSLLFKKNKVLYLTNLDIIEKAINSTRETLFKIREQEIDNDFFIRQTNLERKLEDLTNKYQFLQRKLQEERKKGSNRPRNVDLKNPKNMTSADRWNLYFYWLDLYANYLNNKTKDIEAQYRALYREYAELKDIENLQLMKEMDVIGMTTTGAARLQTTLQALRCPIVIVEEAAEVLESHIIVSLTSHCQHLLLIGDHQQLRPTTADYTMETRFNLGISLFERMVLNNIHLNTLGVQHRMRPEIARLIVPSIYPCLENHETVLHFPQIRGIDHPLYFIHHTEPEEECGDSSKRNNHETQFLIRLALHLILNGYNPEDITILAAYSGQMFSLWRERRKYDTFLRDVRITVLDNYQGEECNIILLSLVRNNDQGEIGFLKIENRVCVALSRAKQGLYIMGNMELLCRKSEIWPKIRIALEEQNSLGECLTLRCQIHQDQITEVRKASDFNNVPEGGCRQMCNMLLNCGHVCKKCCHLRDRDHTRFQCMEKCTKILCTNYHVCPKKCYEECGPCMVPMKRILPCKHEHYISCHVDPDEFLCPTPVEATLPCGHTTDIKPCHADPETFKCPFPCDTRLDLCGHSCRLKCHFRVDPDHIHYKCTKPCARMQKDCSTDTHNCNKMCYEECSQCKVQVKKKRFCTHLFSVECWFDVNELQCNKPCKKELPCGHQCKKKCCDPCGDCKMLVDKESPCGHKIKIACSLEPSREYCSGPCTLMLSCGHRCKSSCNKPCTTRCTELVPNNKPADCGHEFQIPCYLQKENISSNDYNLLKYCSNQCNEPLLCGHFCNGTCGRCAQGRIHQSCAEKCGMPLICGHSCRAPCRESCPPCDQECTYKCVHSKCKKKCGLPCTMCKEECPRRCKHQKCRRPCGSICTVPPCNKPCPKILPCKHPCVGFCGDPCPQLCRVCNKEELTEIFFGYEDEEDARFVLLKECGHVIESRGMEDWLSQNSSEINVKQCPKCKTSLTSTLRYSDDIKEAYEDVTQVKLKFTGNAKENEAKRMELLEKIRDLKVASENLAVYSHQIHDLLDGMKESLLPLKRDRRNNVHRMELNSFEAKIQICEQILNTFELGRLQRLESTQHVVKYISFLLTQLTSFNRMTNQAITDYEAEIKRLNRIVQLYQIEETSSYRMLKSDSKVKDAFQFLLLKVFAPKKYSEAEENIVKEKLTSLNDQLKSNVRISDTERKEILKALDLKQGHWFKCPNGHPYVITECGGAMVKSKCPDCGEHIGGSNHNLLSSNRLAPEIDGARFAAWSDAANMANYGFNI